MQRWMARKVFDEGLHYMDLKNLVSLDLIAPKILDFSHQLLATRLLQSGERHSTGIPTVSPPRVICQPRCQDVAIGDRLDMLLAAQEQNEQKCTVHFSRSQANSKLCFNSVTYSQQFLATHMLFWPVSRIPHISNGAIYALLMDLHLWFISGPLPIDANSTKFQVLKALHFEGFEVNCSRL